MITGIDIKLEPVKGSMSGELFQFRLKRGTYFTFEYDESTTASPYNPLTPDKIMTVRELGNGFDDVVFKIPVRSIRYIKIQNT